MVIKHMKTYSVLSTARKYKLKLQWDATLLQLDGYFKKTLK
jgi:hypothetical protein